jgi:YEATS domain-containing protein 1/3
VKQDIEKSKKDKTKDRERSDKKEKISKRPSSPFPNPSSGSSSAVRNSTNHNSHPASKGDLVKPPSKQSSTPVPQVGLTISKKSNKKDKKNDKERDRNYKKESRAKESFLPKDKSTFDVSTAKNNSGGVKERDSNSGKDDRDKNKQLKINPTGSETKPSIEAVKKPYEKDSERKHKHKKKEKSKDKEPGKDSKKEKQHKSTTITASPAKAKEQIPTKYELSSKSLLSDKEMSDSDVDSPLSIKQYSENSMTDAIIQKPPPETEKPQKKPRERAKPVEKEDKSRKSRKSKKDHRELSLSPPPSKHPRKDFSRSPLLQECPTSESPAHHSHPINNNIDGVSNDRKISNDYMSELKDLKHKITTLKSNDDLQHVVRLIAATGCYEITKSSFDFDLVQLDRSTVQRLQEFFTSS